MSEFASEGSRAADEEVADVRSEPDADLIASWDAGRKGPSRTIGRLPICW
jgi:hypothetical protein